MSEGGEPSAPATPGLILLSYTTPWDAAPRAHASPTFAITMPQIGGVSGMAILVEALAYGNVGLPVNHVTRLARFNIHKL
jgi:hypothetical protein